MKVCLRVKGAGNATLGAEGRHITCVEGPTGALAREAH